MFPPRCHSHKALVDRSGRSGPRAAGRAALTGGKQPADFAQSFEHRVLLVQSFDQRIVGWKVMVSVVVAAML